MFQCVPQMQSSTQAPRVGRFLDGARSALLRTKWLACLTPFFKESERKTCGCQHRLFFSQVEYCDNLIFHRRAALDHLGQRLLDANRTRLSTRRPCPEQARGLEPLYSNR